MADLSYGHIYGDLRVMGDTNLFGLAKKNGIDLATINDNVASATKLKTIRTVSLSGDATGSFTYDGSANSTLSISIKDNSHNHTNYLPLAGGIITGTLVMGEHSIRGISNNKSLTLGKDTSLLSDENIFIHADSNRNSVGQLLSMKAGRNELKLMSSAGSTGNTVLTLNGNKIFNDAYHPNADILTTSRTISLGGDLVGSATFNGGSNITIVGSVSNDSHTHDGRYYTETESNAKYIPFVGNSTLNGNLVISGNLTVQGDATEFNVSNLSVEDNIITTAKNNTGTAAYGGLKFERGSADAYMVFRESDDRFIFGTATNDAMSGLVYKNVQAGTFYGALSGNASTSTKLATARTINLSGDVVGSTSFDGSGNVNISAVVANNSHDHTKYLEKTGGTISGDLRVDGSFKFGSKGSISFNEAEQSIDFIII